jgi:hypothetical protein
MRAPSIRRHIREQKVQYFILGSDKVSVPAINDNSLQLVVPLQHWRRRNNQEVD